MINIFSKFKSKIIATIAILIGFKIWGDSKKREGRDKERLVNHIKVDNDVHEASKIIRELRTKRRNRK